MIDFKMALPPGKECFYVPAEFVDHAELLGCKIIAVGGNPEIDVINPITDSPKLFLSLVYPCGTK